MRLILCLTFLSCLAFGNAKVQKDARIFEDLVYSIFECARNFLINGLPESNFPSMNNLTIDTINISLSDLGNRFSGYLYLESFEFYGLPYYQVSNVKSSVGIIPPSYSVAVTLNFPRVILSTKYKIEAKSDDGEFWGKGTLEFDAYNFKTVIDTKVTISLDIRLNHFTFEVSLDGLNSFEITGALNDEEYSASLSDYVLENGPKIVEDLKAEIGALVEDIFLDLINNQGGFDAGSFLYYIILYCA